MVGHTPGKYLDSTAAEVEKVAPEGVALVQAGQVTAMAVAEELVGNLLVPSEVCLAVAVMGLAVARVEGFED